MKKILFAFLAFAAAGVLWTRPAFAVPKIDPAVALEKVATGGAVLIDVREPSEWTAGVVDGALLLSLSDLQGPRVLWAKELDAAKGRELVLYCRSGNRSGIAGAILEKEGWIVWNAGGYSAFPKSSPVNETIPPKK